MVIMYGGDDMRLSFYFPKAKPMAQCRLRLVLQGGFVLFGFWLLG